MKKRDIKKKKLIIILVILIVLFLLSIGGIIIFTYNKSKKELVEKTRHDVIFKLNEPEEQTVEVKTEYEEMGCSVLVDGEDKSLDLQIDSSNINTDLLGEYKVKYYINLDDREYKYFRVVKVVDSTSPEIKLSGNEKIIIIKGEKYVEPGCIAIDNYDGEITDKVEITSDVDNNKIGEYKVIYSVTDTSGNTSSKERVVVVKNPNKVVVVNNNENKEVKTEVKPTNYSNTITSNKFTDNGFYIEGYKSSGGDLLKLKLVSEVEYAFDLTNLGNGKYKGNININDVNNDTYKLVISSDKDENLLNKMDFIDRIKRAKVGNKLVTFDYKDDSILLTIDDFSYLYDVLIDPGHGGDDTGATNKYIMEKEMNLEVSLYEKCRFESHGFKVYMTRTNDGYGNGIGPSNLKRLHRRAYEIGYYGSVSKVVYSNHHNAIDNKSFRGYEILVPASLTSSNLANELEIMHKFNSIYPSLDNHMRFYGRDYDTEKKYNMTTGNTYSFKDNYAVNRIPLNLFNTKAVIYEGSYLTNDDDYKWYWNDKNWVKVSEAKIETYINYMGGSYNSDNSSCLS